MSILLALLAAVAYGLADFVGGVTSKRASPWAVAFVVQVSGAAVVLALGLVVGGDPTGADYLWGVVAGIGNGFGTAYLYRGLSSGRMGVVAPISGVGAALVPVVVGLATGERPSSLVWVGIVAALPGIWLVAREPAVKSATRDVPASSGLVDGVLAGLGFGSLFAALAQIPEGAGFLPLALNLAVAAGVVVGVATMVGASWLPGRTASLGAVSGLLAAVATGAFLLASQGGYLTVTAVLASLYPAFTVLLAATVLREHVHRTQAVGLVLCGIAVTLVAAGDTSAEPSATSASSGSGPSAVPATSGSPEPDPEPEPGAEPVRAVVVHHTRSIPQAGRTQIRRVVSVRPPTWRGLRLVGTIGEVARDPGSYAVVAARRVSPSVRLVGLDGRPPGPVTTLRVVGDVMLGRGVPSARAALAPMTPFLRSADLTVGNLESTLSDDGVPQQPGDDSFHADPSVVPLLAQAGFDALSLANNHTGDYQERALLRTVERLRGSPILPFGAGADLRSATRPAVIERNGVRFGFLGFNAIGETPRATPTTPGALSVRMPPRTGPLVRADLTHLVRAVRRLDRRADVVVVVPHWGANYSHVADPAQRLVARRLAAAGADLVAGGHPHWVQGLDRVRDTVVAHSLGNYVFDMDFMEQTMQGVVLTATFWGAELRAVELTPYRLDAAFAPRPVSATEAAAILRDVWSHSTGPFRSVS